MSDSEARWPFFITCVLSSTLSCSVSCFFDSSTFSTLPVIWFWLELPAEAVPPDAELPELPIEPEEPLLPIEPWSDEDEPDPPSVPEDEPLEPELPLADEPVDPEDEVSDAPALLLLSPAAAGSATSRLAIPSPAIIPFLIFM
jgi:hypothetical protein